MLLDNFFTYTLTQTQENECIAAISLDKSHSIYQGHFPEIPIVPGVCQIQILKEILQNIFGLEILLTQAKEVKFLSMLNPEEQDKFDMKITYEKTLDSELKVSAISYFNEIKYLKIKADYSFQLPSYSNEFKQKKCCVLIPTYNNATKLAGVIEDVLQYTSEIIIVNDGSTDNTSEILKQFPQIQSVQYLPNKGKGDALKTGFRFASKQGYEYAITLDSDGQHYAKDLPTFLKGIDTNPNTILIGSRELNQENVPSKSSFANKFSNFWFQVETGQTLSDTQSGYRLYPLVPLKKMHFFSKKYEFELEVIVRAVWKGIGVKPVGIDVYYPVKEERITHFRPFKDFFRISVLNTILVTLAILIYRPLLFLRELKKKNFKQIIRDDIFGTNTPIHVKAKSLGFGVFMGIVPIWGYQLIVGFFIAHLLKLNKALFFIAANISIPPFIPFILYLSVVTGSYVLGRGTWAIEISLDVIKTNLLQYIVGSFALATLAGISVGIVSYIILKISK